MNRLVSLGIRFLLGAIIGLSLVACSSGSGSGSGRSVTTQEKALDSSITAMSSLGSLALSRRAFSTRAQDTDAICDENGSSLSTGNDTEWAFTSFLCAGAHNTYSPDSALGALTLMKGIVCMASEAGVTYSASGGSATFASAALTTTCFPAAMLETFADDGVTSVSGTVAGFSLTGSGWDFRLEFRSMSPISDFDIFVRSSNNVIAAAFVSRAGDVDSWTVTIDRRQSPNSIIYEAANQNRHIRLAAEGSISTSGVVNSVEDMAGILAESTFNQYVSLTGNEDDGVRISWEKSGMGEETNECFDFGGPGTCAGVTELAFHAAERAGFTTSLATTIDRFDDNPIYFSISGFSVANDVSGNFTSNLR